MDQIGDPASFLYGKCASCPLNFNVTFLPNIPPCEHLVCDSCFKYRSSLKRNTYSCATCHKFLNLFEAISATRGLRAHFKKFAKFCDDVKRFEDEKEQDIKNLKEVVEAKSDEIEKLIESQALTQVGDVECSECGNCDDEKKIQICDSCVNGKFENLGSFIERVRLSEVEFKSIVICPLCAIRNHLKKGHEVSDFYPILREFRFENHYQNLKPKRENNQQENEKLKLEVGDVITVIDEGEEQLNRMTEMMKRSKTTALQENVAVRIAKQIETNLKHVGKFRAFVGDLGGKMKAIKRELEEDNDIEDAANCDDEPPAKKSVVE